MKIVNPEMFVSFRLQLLKTPRVHKMFVRNSGAGNDCANFMGTWKICVLSAGKPMSRKFLVLGGGGVFWVFFGGGSADFIFMGAGIFLIVIIVLIMITHTRSKKMVPLEGGNLSNRLPA